MSSVPTQSLRWTCRGKIGAAHPALLGEHLWVHTLWMLKLSRRRHFLQAQVWGGKVSAAEKDNEGTCSWVFSLVNGCVSQPFPPRFVTTQQALHYRRDTESNAKMDHGYMAASMEASEQFWGTKTGREMQDRNGPKTRRPFTQCWVSNSGG
jgi:hypothetical protein